LNDDLGVPKVRCRTDRDRLETGLDQNGWSESLRGLIETGVNGWGRGINAGLAAALTRDPGGWGLTDHGCLLATLARGRSCSLTVTFRPGRPMTENSSVVVTDDDPRGGNQQIDVRATT
jgi:hypothetical protein